MNSQQISATILTKNCPKYLREVLRALDSFGEVALYDNGSTDETLSIAGAFPNVSIHEGPFLGFGPTHNKISTLAKNEWILSIDSDEVVTPELVQTINELELNPKCIYTFPRHNYFNGKWIRWCGWYPDRVIRLYHRDHAKFSGDQVHESIQKKGLRVVNLDSPIVHYSYGSIHDFLSKMQTYSDLFAKQNKGKKSSSLTKAILHGFWAFLKSYILKRGFLAGKEGYIISAYNGHTAFYKYLKLAEANNDSLVH